ncbi:hypothetical protein [Aliarcobacter cryaerophilus]|uniref:hypothetical protein n=1 Tax=Aliarcobacter cryaerophilus TaxID=28198 RepID=UPI003BB08207
MKNTIFVLRGRARIGKTTTIKKVRELLLQKSGVKEYKVEFEILNRVDIRVVLDINGVLVGIETQGDPSSRLEESIELFIKAKCKIIVCASRTSGMTVDWINKYSKAFNIEWIEKKNAENDSERENLNNKKAEEIVEKIFCLLELK